VGAALTREGDGAVEAGQTVSPGAGEETEGLWAEPLLKVYTPFPGPRVTKLTNVCTPPIDLAALTGQ
jgi:hypothetical protein